MDTSLILVILTIVFALTFDFLNGFHDAANSIATVVSTRVLSPKLAVVWAAFFNFLAAFIFGTAVAKTIGQGMIHLELNHTQIVTQYVVMAGLLGAIVWDLLTWIWGLPTSSSHALIGGYAGAAIAKAGFKVVIASGWTKTLIFIVVAPIMGLVMGFGLMVAVYWIFQQPISAPGRRSLSKNAITLGRCLQPRTRWQRRAENHGHHRRRTLYRRTDDQSRHCRRIGDITTGLSSSSANAAIAMGTYFGGWRIVHTMGSKITKLKPVGGFCAEICWRYHSLRYRPGRYSREHHAHYHRRDHRRGRHPIDFRPCAGESAKRIVWAWVLTIPASAAVAAFTYWIVTLFKPGA